MDKFRSKINHLIVFEKSATYFDNPDAPRTAAALLPKADVVVSKLCFTVGFMATYFHETIFFPIVQILDK